jgi:flagellar L-ring protein precursor FlgH
MKKTVSKKIAKATLISSLCVSGCQPASMIGSMVPAEDFAKAAQNGNINDYSFRKAASAAKEQELIGASNISKFVAPEGYQGDTKMLSQGLELKRSFAAPQTISEEKVTTGGGVESARGQLAGHNSTSSPFLMASANFPQGSSSPYAHGQMNANPSLWPDKSEGVFLFNDHRAFSPMDILTVLINDNTQGLKQGNTQTKTEFDLLAGITNFFGIETKSWASNNEALVPSALINASTENEFKGQGNIQRQARLQANMSAVVMEVLPNGTLRIEGSKIVAINNEEEIMVISGLVRKRDIAGDNQVDSNRIANMRIDFYGHGTLSESQSPGWGSRIFNVIWPF